RRGGRVAGGQLLQGIEDLGGRVVGGRGRRRRGRDRGGWGRRRRDGGGRDPDGRLLGLLRGRDLLLGSLAPRRRVEEREEGRHQVRVGAATDLEPRRRD